MRCFQVDPSIKSSLAFLRRTPWAREKVEGLYLFMLREQRRNARRGRRLMPLRYLGRLPARPARPGARSSSPRAGWPRACAGAIPKAHEVRTDRALYDYVGELKARHMRNAPPLAKVQYDMKLHVVRNALGTHTTVSRVQGSKLKAKREIRIASLFKQAPAPFLRMIVVHELAHLKEREHDKAFYALCTHMEPDYHQLELDVRLWLTALELERGAGG